MSLKSLKFWHNWFQRKASETDPLIPANPEAERKHPSPVTIRAALRQKQKMTKMPAQ